MLVNSCADKSDKVFAPDEDCSQKVDEENPEECQCNSYYFPCRINDTLQCIHPELVCDGHAACDNSEDEVLTPDCIEKLTKLKTIKPEATKVCTSPMYSKKKMQTVGVACDGVVECLNGEDEGWLCTNYKWPFYGTMFVCGMILLSLIVFKLFKNTFAEIMEDSQLLILPNVLNQEIFYRDHDKESFREHLNLFIQFSKQMDSKQERIAKNKKLYKLESRYHRGNVAETRLCLKNTLDWSNAKILIDDAFPGCLRRNMEWLEIVLDTLDKWGWSYWILNKVKTISSIYIDLFKDTFIMTSIFIIIGGPTSLYFFPTKLTSVVVYCFMATIILPLICSSLLYTQRQLKNQSEMPLWRKICAYSFGLVLSPVRPLLIAEAFEENKAQRKAMIKFNNHKETVLNLNQEGRQLRRAYSEFIRVDLGLEVMFQLSGQVKQCTKL